MHHVFMNFSRISPCFLLIFILSLLDPWLDSQFMLQHYIHICENPGMPYKVMAHYHKLLCLESECVLYPVLYFLMPSLPQ